MTTASAKRLDHQTREVLVSQFIECTGQHMCDSGGTNGRGYQRRIAAGLTTVAAWDKEPAAYLDIWNYKKERYVTHDSWHPVISAYHLLAQLVTFDKVMDHHLKAFLHLNDEGILFCQEDEWTAYLQDQPGVDEVRGALSRKLEVTYTYNFANMLDCDLQYHLFAVRGGELEGDYISLQTHNGADARGGLSDPRVYRFGYSGFDTFMMSLDMCHIECANGHSWQRDDYSYEYYDKNTQDQDDEKADLLKQDLMVVPDATGKEHLACPICGARLQAYQYGT